MKNTRFVQCSFEGFCIVAVLGTLEPRLEELSEIYSRNGKYKLEFTPIKKQRDGRYLSALLYKPPADMAITKSDENNSASFRVISLDRVVAYSLIEDFISAVNFSVTEPTDDFTSDTQHVFLLEIENYNLLKKIAREHSINLQEAFRRVCFKTFQEHYKI